MIFFIDTNIFVAALRGRAPHVRTRMQQHDPRNILVPHQVVAELRVGAAKSARPGHNNMQVSVILQPFAIAWPDAVALEHYADIRVTLERADAHRRSGPLDRRDHPRHRGHAGYPQHWRIFPRLRPLA